MLYLIIILQSNIDQEYYMYYDALSRMYEACYTSTWGVPIKDPQEIIQQHNLDIDKDILISMSQPPPLLDMKRRRNISAASASRGGDMKIEFEPSDADPNYDEIMESKYYEPSFSDSDVKHDMETVHSKPRPQDDNELKL